MSHPSPAPQPNPIVPSTGLPISDTNNGSTTVTVAGAPPAAPAVPPAAPTATTVQDVYTQLKADGQKLVDAANSVSQDAGNLLILELKAGANFLASAFGKLQVLGKNAESEALASPVTAELQTKYQDFTDMLHNFIDVGEEEGVEKAEEGLAAMVKSGFAGIEKKAKGILGKLMGKL